MRALPVRTRLTLLYFAFFAAAGLLLSATSWFLLQRSLDALMKHELDERIDDLESILRTQGNTTSIAELQALLRQEYAFKDEGKWLQVVDQSGHWLYFSSRPRIRSAIPPSPNTTGTLVKFQESPGHSIVTLHRTIVVDQGRYETAMAISSDRSMEILKQFRKSLLFTVPIVLIGAAGMGHFLSRKALTPIQTLVKEVQQIHDQNLSRRLPVSTARDELSQLSEQLNQMLERIDFAFRGVNSLTANASHELRTPLTLIRTRVEIALCFPRSAEEYRTVLEEVQNESVQMSAMLEKLLWLARRDAGNAPPLEFEFVPLAAMLRKAELEWSPVATRSGISFTVFEPDAEVYVTGNRDALDRLVRTLVDNAHRYTPSGGWVRLSGEQVGESVVLRVEDNGIGITAEDIPRIFERFYRGRHSQSLQPSGSGLGLALAQWIANQHGATISVESAPGRGTTFAVQFMRLDLVTHVNITMEDPKSLL